MFAQDDGRSERATVAVPEEHAKLGRVYQIVAGEKTQMTFRSKAKKEEIKGTSTLMTGYVVVPTGDDSLPAKFAAGKFQLPVLSMDTGNPSMNDHMQAKRWLNNPAYPQIAFTISDVQDVKVIKERENSTLYKAKLVGAMSLAGAEKELTVTARIKFLRENKKTRKIAPGDLITIRSSFYVVLSEFGMGIDDPAIENGKIAKKIKIDINLTLSSEPS